MWGAQVRSNLAHVQLPEGCEPIALLHPCVHPGKNAEKALKKWWDAVKTFVKDTSPEVLQQIEADRVERVEQLKRAQQFISTVGVCIRPRRGACTPGELFVTVESPDYYLIYPLLFSLETSRGEFSLALTLL